MTKKLFKEMGMGGSRGNKWSVNALCKQNKMEEKIKTRRYSASNDPNTFLHLPFPRNDITEYKLNISLFSLLELPFFQLSVLCPFFYWYSYITTYKELYIDNPL